MIQLLGAGGMGAVYVAEHTGIGKRVAVKFLHPHYAQDAKTVRRFHQEARAAAAAGHRNIIDVHDIGQTDDGAPYIVMDLLSGESLRGTLERERALPVGRAAAIIVEVLSGLSAAHQKGIVHRDLKPDNVFLETTAVGGLSVKLLDFGISKMSDGGLEVATGTGTTLGTPHYMAPEQARGQRDLDHRVDLYAVGAMFYESLAGRVPLDADNYNAMIVKILTESPDPLSSIRTDLPPGLEDVVDKALAKDRDRRFQKAADFGEALLPFADMAGASARVGSGPMFAVGPSATPHPETRVAPSTQTGRAAGSRGRGAWIVGGVLASAAIAVGAILLAGPPAESTAEPVIPAVLPASAAPATDAPATASAPEDATVQVDLSGVPEGARVTLDGAEVTLPIRVPREARDRTLRVEKRGHQTFERSVVPDRDQTVAVELPLVRAGRVRTGAVQATTAATSAPSTTAPATSRGARTKAPILTDTGEFGP